MAVLCFLVAVRRFVVVVVEGLVAGAPGPALASACASSAVGLTGTVCRDGTRRAGVGAGTTIGRIVAWVAAVEPTAWAPVASFCVVVGVVFVVDVSGGVGVVV